MNLKNFISNHKITFGIIIFCTLGIIACSFFIIRNSHSEPVSEVINNEEFETHDSKLSKHQYNMDNFKDENGWKKYYDDNGNLISSYGIDISYYQKDIDWEKLKSEGINFVMLRAGYRGYESGSLFVDKNFYKYAQEAENAGINIGIYFFSQSNSIEEAEEEARYTLDIIKNCNITYPVAYDWEPVEEEKSRTFPVNYLQLTESAIKFCDIIKEAGYTPIVYANRSQALNYYDMEKISQYDLWLAEYFDEPEYPYEFTMWQYTSEGKIDGIEGRVDLNICFKNYAE
jgi:GH25 family lysozyme M1 (1,4-beta-N-acetylmuramidase)